MKFIRYDLRGISQVHFMCIRELVKLQDDVMEPAFGETTRRKVEVKLSETEKRRMKLAPRARSPLKNPNEWFARHH